MSWYGGFKPYVPVARRRAQAAREVAKRMKNGQVVCPVKIEGRTIASTFWGKAWCTNLESYSDFENRLPRGRTYVRNGSVVHLTIKKGRINALVSGSELYEVQIEIAALPAPTWKMLRSHCAGKFGTLVELLQGKLSQAVMEVVTDRAGGLFPKPQEIKMRCSCPDYAGMCKHVAAVMYGVGNRLDKSPELLFQLRGVDHKEMIEQAIPSATIGIGTKGRKIAAADLGDIFGIEIGDAPAPKVVTKRSEKPATKAAAKPAAKPTVKATAKPTAKPMAKVTVKTTAKSTAKPSPKPTAKVTAQTSKPTTTKVGVAEKASTSKGKTPKSIKRKS